LLVEGLVLDGHRPRTGLLGQWRVVDTVSVLGRRADDTPKAVIGRSVNAGPKLTPYCPWVRRRIRVTVATLLDHRAIDSKTVAGVRH